MSHKHLTVSMKMNINDVFHKTPMGPNRTIYRSNNEFINE
ncbi:hypothetical protein MsAc7_09820 [Methanolapillus millepedarum]|uniref:Uncharacterized protein n=1 Tax=Methanolapillus millepedarum TaxID=3028296 RepID=A0AA96ZU86_9EURY|nr:hypothetical protein MsAc7_09820 [Methanosarcinaceae archaeon Ac7]